MKAYTKPLPLIGGLSLLAIVAGVSLGRSAIAEINPVYFQEAPSHFYADLVPYKSSGNVQPDLGGSDYLQADYSYSAAAACRDCDDYPVDYRPRHDPAVDGIEDGRSASAPRDAMLVEDDPPSDPPPPNRAWIERYTDYTVAAEPAEADQAGTADPASPVAG